MAKNTHRIFDQNVKDSLLTEKYEYPSQVDAKYNFQG